MLSNDFKEISTVYCFKCMLAGLHNFSSESEMKPGNLIFNSFTHSGKIVTKESVKVNETDTVLFNKQYS